MWDYEAVAKAWARMQDPAPVADRRWRPDFRQVATATAVVVLLGLLSPIPASGLFDWLDSRSTPAVHPADASFPVGPALPLERATSPQPAAHAGPPSGDTILLEFAWAYGHREWMWSFDLDQAVVDDYRARDRHAYSDEYAVFVMDRSDDVLMAALAGRIREAADERGFSDRETLEFALAFVQSLPYAVDDPASGYDEYPRYPVETLVDKGADCEDTSILFASLAAQLGFDAVLLSPPGHMGVGIALERPVTVEHDGTGYAYVETTGAGWGLGEVPDAYRSQDMHVYSLEPSAVLSRPAWTAGWADGRYEVEIGVENVGSEDAHDVVMYAAFEAGQGLVWDQGRCDPVDLAPGQRATCTVRLRSPPEGESSRLLVSAWADDARGKTSQSQAFTA